MKGFALAVIRRGSLPWWSLGFALVLGTQAAALQQAGAIRGVVYDKDFGVPLPGAQVAAVEADQKVTTSDQGNFVFSQVPPGKYTLVFSKEGYVRQVVADVVVSAGKLTDVDISLSGEFTEMDEFVVQDILGEAGTEAQLIGIRLDSPALMDSISADLMSRAGASDAGAALKLIPGASLQDGKFAVIRGLPDRYVSSQMNGIRLPSADEDKRAVELDQFPAAVLESIRVTKTFTPDQQGDASGGAVDVRLRGIPDEAIFQLKGQLSYNSQVTGNDDFLTYEGGGVSGLGNDDGDRDIQFESLGGNWDGAVGTTEGDAPIDYKLGLDAGGKYDLGDGVKFGAFTSLFYERDSSFYDDGIDDSYWVPAPGGELSPEFGQGTPKKGSFLTSLFDVTQGSESVQWGGLGTLGLETENHSIRLTGLYTHIAEDTATLAIDTRGKEHFFPGYDPDDPMDPGNASRGAAPYLRLETLEYTERTTGTLQLHGDHKLPGDGFDFAGLDFRAPEIDWAAALSFADLDQPDKRQFGAEWLAPSFIGPSIDPAVWIPYKPDDNFTIGNLQRIWKTIEEDSQQFFVNLKFPFEQWSGDEGYFKTGVFNDEVDRKFDQETFSNFGDVGPDFFGDFDEPWSGVFDDEDHAIRESFFDVDYDGRQEISALYGMIDLPLAAPLNLIGGARFESTEIEIVNFPEELATWLPPDEDSQADLEPGDADVAFDQDDVLPSIGLIYEAGGGVTLRGSYGETVARQTFKELTPILQQEYLGGPVFVGNPDLQMSALKNYDLRLDYVPYDGGLVSASWFSKDIEDPIEYVQRLTTFSFTTPQNYPEGELSGIEVELRQQLERFWDGLEGLALGANATFIESEVEVPTDEAGHFELLGFPMSSRDMTNAPEYLYNVYLTLDLEDTGTQFAIFYTVQGDTLVAGAGALGNTFVPNVYAEEYGTLNMSLSQVISKHWKLQLQGKNLTNPEIEEVYRMDSSGDQTKTSYTKGAEFSIGLAFRL